jgi:hypothetical protein
MCPGQLRFPSPTEKKNKNGEGKIVSKRLRKVKAILKSEPPEKKPTENALAARVA